MKCNTDQTITVESTHILNSDYTDLSIVPFVSFQIDAEKFTKKLEDVN